MSEDAEQKQPRWVRQVSRDRDVERATRQLRRELTETQGRVTRLEQKARDEARFLQLQRAKEVREYQETALAAEMSELEQEAKMELPHGHAPDIDAGLPDQPAARQASSRGDLWSGDFEHSPGFMAAIGSGASIAELRRRSADAMITEAVRREPSPVMYQSRSWCGKGSCRPATPCPSCAGHRVVVKDGSATAAPVQASTHPGQSLWQQYPEHRAVQDTGPDPQASAAMTARRQTLPPRPPADGAEILKGL